MKHIFACAILLAFVSQAWAQEVVLNEETMYDLSLEELMNIPIHSASKKQETLFDAPLSSYTVTRSEIEKSGATTIMEALRLVPGLIVREQSNGVYDIHIRGLDNLLRHSESFTKNNLYTLVMIDSRPAFNHNLGGTFWEALPVDVMDVERIEIVRGPSAPLFGPNAVTGVVNIITRRVESSETLVSANVEGGAPSTLIANAMVGKRFNQRFSSSLSFNYQERERFDERFYNNATGEYQDGESFMPNLEKGYPNPERAMQKLGVNGYFTYSRSENVKFDLSAGFQNSESLKNMLSGFGTILTNSTSDSYYANLSAKVSDLTVRTSFTSGKDNILYGSTPSQYDYHVTDLNAEYTFKFGDKVSVVPGFNYQNAVFTDEAYFGEAEKGFLNGTEQSISTISGFVRSDLNLTDNWRVIAAVRADKFSSPDDLYLAYEFASTYKINDNNLIRAAVTRSNSGAYIGYNKLNYIEKDRIPVGGGLSVDQIQRGNPNLELLTVNMIELGFRTKLTSNLQLDVDLFRQTAENLTAIVVKGFTTYPPTPDADFIIDFDNVPVTATQVGGTLAVNFVPDKKWQFKPFVTIQSTETENLPDSYYDPTLNTVQPGSGFPEVTYSNSKHKYTPSVYGGFYLNFKASEKFNLNSSAYFLGEQTWYRSAAETVDADAAFLLNFKASYAITDKISVYANGRNMFNSEKPQFLGADFNGALYMGGISFNVK